MTRLIFPKTLAAALLGMAIATSGLPGLAASGGGTNTKTATAVPTYIDAKAAADAGNYAGAIQTLRGLVKTDPKNADAWNLLGFSSRKLKKYDDAGKYYDTALRLDPKHRGALEYQGELFIATQAFDKAKANLAKLKTLCGTCSEYADLKTALAKAGQS